MSDENFNNSIFDNHSAFNRYQSIDGMRVNNGATKPSIYITEIKLKNALRDLSNIEIQDIFEKEMPDYNCDIHREKLKKKIASLQEWQILKALSILLGEGKYYSIIYVNQCKRTDREEKA